MSKLALLLLPGLFACDRSAAPEPVFIDGIDSAPLLACTEHDGTMMPGSPLELATLNDTVVAALFADARTFVLLDSSLTELRRVEFAKDGPNGVLDPASVLIHGDSLYVADAKGERVTVLDWNGRAGRSVRTEFTPLQVIRHGDDVAVVPAVIGRFPGTLLFDLRGNNLVRRTVPVVDFPDLTTKALGNRVKLLALGDELLLLHQFFTPRALRIADGLPRELRVPLPNAARRAIGYRPPLPLNDEALRPALVVANDAVVTERNEILMLVRSGRSKGDRFEKAIMRTDSLLNYLTAYRLPVGAGLLGYFPRNRLALVVDEEDQWHTCVLPS
jgi:hypothetical protein